MVFKTIIKPTIILTLTAFISGFILVNVNNITSPAIKLNQMKKEKTAIGLVLPGFTVDNTEFSAKKDDGTLFRYWIGEKEDPENPSEIIKGYAFVASRPGYSGSIDSMVGVDEVGKILGISIINQTETPGLGARCIEIMSSYTIWDLPKILSGELSTGNEEEQIPWFQRQFEGLNTQQEIKIVKIGDWTVEKEQALLEQNAITAITGATITGRAIIDSIKEGCAVLQKNLLQTEADEL